MGKHTPGPWRLSAESPFIVKQDYTHIGLGESSGVLIGSACSHERSGFFPSTEEGLANARLIAAAPDLLAALLQIQSMGYTDVGDRLMVGAAIAKATGVEP